MSPVFDKNVRTSLDRGTVPASRALVTAVCMHTAATGGPIKRWSLDFLSDAFCDAIFDFDIAAPRQTVWEYLTVPGQWQKWWPTDGIIEHSGNRRRGVGTTNYCMHGKDAIIEELLDWRPFDYFTVSALLPMPDAPKLVMTSAVQERPNGTTRLEMRLAKPKPKDMAFVDQFAPTFKGNLTKAIETLRRILEERQTSIAVIDEPSLRPSNERFLTVAGEIKRARGRVGVAAAGACPVLSRTMKQAAFASSIVQGGEKRRAGMAARSNGHALWGGRTHWRPRLRRRDAVYGTVAL